MVVLDRSFLFVIESVPLCTSDFAPDRNSITYQSMLTLPEAVAGYLANDSPVDDDIVPLTPVCSMPLVSASQSKIRNEFDVFTATGIVAVAVSVADMDAAPNCTVAPSRKQTAKYSTVASVLPAALIRRRFVELVRFDLILLSW